MTARPSLRAVLFACISVAIVSSPAMASYRWSKRPLYIFGPDATAAEIVAQRRTIDAGREGLRERDMVVVWVLGTTVAAEPGPAPAESPRALRQRLGAETGSFRMVLVGKDGGVKQTWTRPTELKAVFATVDGMPMRRDEMRRQ